MKLKVPVLLFVLWFDVTLSGNSNEKQCTNKLLSGEVSSYGDCMDEFTNDLHKSWPLYYLQESECVETVVKNANSVCAPATISIEAIVYPDPSTSDLINLQQTKYHEYLIVKWTACAVGISDATGFIIKPRKMYENSYFPCLDTKLLRNLTTDDVLFLFSAPLLQPIEYGKEYMIDMESTPLTEQARYYTHESYIAKTCFKLNAHDICVCDFNDIYEDLSDEPFVEFYNASVRVVVQNFTFCPDYHSLMIYVKILGGEDYVLMYEFNREALQESDGFLETTFNNFFPVAKDLTVEILYVLSGYSKSNNLLHRYSKHFEKVDSILDIEESIKRIKVDDNVVTATFDCIVFDDVPLVYTFKMAKRTEKDKIDGWFDLKNVTCENAETTVKFVVVNSGVYSLQMRQNRPLPFTQQPWSTLSDKALFTVKVRQNTTIKLAIILPIILLSLIIFIIVCCHCTFSRNKAYRKHISRNIPKKLAPYIESQTESLLGVHKETFVWIVWKSECLTTEMEKIHAENVRMFAAYLSIHCGLRVIMDQFDLKHSSSFSSWLIDMHKQAEVVLFVIPYTSTDNNSLERFNKLGNFDAIFRYFEKDIYGTQNNDLTRFASVLFPYSDVTSDEESTKCLLKMTKTYNIMDDIEDLYFFIQGRSKFNLFGRAKLQGVNKNDYLETSEGKMLQRGFDIIASQYSTSSSSKDCSCLTQSQVVSSCGSSQDYSVGTITPTDEINNDDFVVQVAHPPSLTELDAADVETSILLINSRDIDSTFL